MFCVYAQFQRTLLIILIKLFFKSLTKNATQKIGQNPGKPKPGTDAKQQHGHGNQDQLLPTSCRLAACRGIRRRVLGHLAHHHSVIGAPRLGLRGDNAVPPLRLSEPVVCAGRAAVARQGLPGGRQRPPKSAANGMAHNLQDVAMPAVPPA